MSRPEASGSSSEDQHLGERIAPRRVPRGLTSIFARQVGAAVWMQKGTLTTAILATGARDNSFRPLTGSWARSSCTVTTEFDCRWKS